jgi:hypothetical protein
MKAPQFPKPQTVSITVDGNKMVAGSLQVVGMGNTVSLSGLTNIVRV